MERSIEPHSAIILDPVNALAATGKLTQGSPLSREWMQDGC